MSRSAISGPVRRARRKTVDCPSAGAGPAGPTAVDSRPPVCTTSRAASARKEHVAKPLVIVESPAKARTIARFLGDGYVVESSVGHIRDLPRKPEDIPAAY